MSICVHLRFVSQMQRLQYITGQVYFTHLFVKVLYIFMVDLKQYTTSIAENDKPTPPPNPDNSVKKLQLL